LGTMLMHRWMLRAAALGAVGWPPLPAAVLQAAALGAAAIALQTRARKRVPSELLVAVAVLELASCATLRLLGSAANVGVSLALISGTAPLSAMVMSCVVFRRRYSPVVWVGAALILVGFGWAVPLAGAGVPVLLVSSLAYCVPGLAMIGKEKLLKESRGPSALFAVACAASVAQLLVFSCFSVEGVAVAEPVARNAGTLASHALVSTGLRLSLAWALQATSAVAVQFANALAVHLFSVLALSPVVGWRGILGLLICGCGCLAAAAVAVRELSQPVEEAPDVVEKAQLPQPSVETESIKATAQAAAVKAESQVQLPKPCVETESIIAMAQAAAVKAESQAAEADEALLRAEVAEAARQAAAVKRRRDEELRTLEEVADASRKRREADEEAKRKRREAAAEAERQRALVDVQKAQRAAGRAEEAAQRAERALAEVDNPNILGQMWKPWMLKQRGVLKAATENALAATEKALAAKEKALAANRAATKMRES